MDSQYLTVLEGLRTLTGIPDLTMDMIDYVPDEAVIDSVLAIGEDRLSGMASDPSRLSLQMLDGMKAVQGYTKKIAQGSIYGKPDIALQVSASYGGSIDSNWLDGDTWGVNITLALKTTLWDGGKKLNDIKRADHDAASASIDYDSAVRTIEETVSTTYAAAELSKEKIAYGEMKLDLDELKADKERNAFSIGSSSESNVIQAELQVIQDRIEIITERIALSQSVYTLMYLSGLDADRLPAITDGMA